MLTDSISEVTQAIIDLIRSEHKKLGLKDVYKDDVKYGVFYGEERGGFLALPAICVDPVYKRLNTSDMGNIKRPQFNIHIVQYYCEVLKTNAIVRKEADERAQTLEEVINSSRDLDGKVVQGWVTGTDSGFSSDGRGSFLLAHRLTWKGQSRSLF